MVQSCTQCQQHQKTPALAPLHAWEWPTRPFIWTIHAHSWGAVPHRGACTLKVDRVHGCAIYLCTGHNSPPTFNIQDPWTPRDHCVRERKRFHWFRIPRIYDSKWNLTHCISPLPSSHQWLSGAGSADQSKESQARRCYGTISFPLQEHPTLHYRTITGRVTPWSSTKNP